MKKIFKAFALMFVAFSLNAQSGNYNPIPCSVQGGELEPLRDLVDYNLQRQLLKQLKSNKKWAKLIANKKMSVGLVDLRDMNNIKFARVNGDNMMYAASLPKIAVLLAAMDALEKGELKETAAVKADMKLMIAKSNNQATTRMIDRIGFDKIEAVLTDPKYDLYNKEFGGGLWVGKRYAGGGKRKPDPLYGISHGATVSQVCRFYYMLLHGQLVCEQRSEQMLDIMVDPKLHHKFVNTLDRIAPDAKVYRKSGSWRNFHSDSALVWGADRQYILVALLDDPKGESIIRRLVLEVEKVLDTNKKILAKK
ncbi:MAG: serine hydrolase [Saprospiraceae bacterium]